MLNYTPIPVTFINLFTRQHLFQTTLPVLPTGGDEIYLGRLAYGVAHCEWRLTPAGLIEVQVVLRPQLDADEQRPFSYPEEANLWAQWMEGTLEEE
jgi:hypothetical protein